jgi:hypothetical protein
MELRNVFGTVEVLHLIHGPCVSGMNMWVCGYFCTAVIILDYIL